MNRRPDRLARRDGESDLEWRLRVRLADVGLPDPERQVIFHPRRRWRFDLAWPHSKVAIEIQGAIWSNGRHVRGTGYVEDCDKRNAATLLGWRVLYVTDRMIDSGEVDDLLRCAISRAGAPLLSKGEHAARYGY